MAPEAPPAPVMAAVGDCTYRRPAGSTTTVSSPGAGPSCPSPGPSTPWLCSRSAVGKALWLPCPAEARPSWLLSVGRWRAPWSCAPEAAGRWPASPGWARGWLWVLPAFLPLPRAAISVEASSVGSPGGRWAPPGSWGGAVGPGSGGLPPTGSGWARLGPVGPQGGPRGELAGGRSLRARTPRQGRGLPMGMPGRVAKSGGGWPCIQTPAGGPSSPHAPEGWLWGEL